MPFCSGTGTWIAPDRSPGTAGIARTRAPLPRNRPGLFLD